MSVGGVHATSLTSAPETPLVGTARNYALSLLLLIYILNFVDRQIVNILAEPIKRDLDLEDWQLGVMTGLAFALFYTVLGIPIARLAERANRVRIIAVSLAVWSVLTAACGVAQSFVQLLLCRIGVGIGEAGCTPAAHSLITDYVPPEKRASALAFYSLGIPLGSMAGMAFGGIIAHCCGWRTALLAVGAPGVLVALIALATLRETRGPLTKATPDTAPSFAAAMRELASKRSFWLAAVGASLTSFTTFGHQAFYGSFFLRNHAEQVAALSAAVDATTGWDLGQVGLIGLALGLMIGIAGVLGTFLGGACADRLGAKDKRAYMDVPAAAVSIGVPFAAAAFLSGNAVAALVLLFVPTLLKSFWYGPVFATAQSLVPPRSRATAAALLLFIVNLIGLGLGPLIIGAMSDALAIRLGEGDGLRWALALSSGSGLISACCFIAARRTLRADMVS